MKRKTHMINGTNGIKERYIIWADLCMQEGPPVPLLIRCSSATTPDVQILLPLQASFSDDAGDGTELHAEMLSARDIAPHTVPRHRIVAVVVSRRDSPAENPALEAALQVDPSFSRCVHCLVLALSRCRNTRSEYKRMWPYSQSLLLLSTS
jgi:hypothetical protein